MIGALASPRLANRPAQQRRQQDAACATAPPLSSRHRAEQIAGLTTIKSVRYGEQTSAQADIREAQHRPKYPWRCVIEEQRMTAYPRHAAMPAYRLDIFDSFGAVRAVSRLPYDNDKQAIRAV
jgi:hypothetical protein